MIRADIQIGKGRESWGEKKQDSMVSSIRTKKGGQHQNCTKIPLVAAVV